MGASCSQENHNEKSCEKKSFSSKKRSLDKISIISKIENSINENINFHETDINIENNDEIIEKKLKKLQQKIGSYFGDYNFKNTQVINVDANDNKINSMLSRIFKKKRKILIEKVRLRSCEDKEQIIFQKSALISLKTTLSLCLDLKSLKLLAKLYNLDLIDIDISENLKKEANSVQELIKRVSKKKLVNYSIIL